MISEEDKAKRKKEAQRKQSEKEKEKRAEIKARNEAERQMRREGRSTVYDAPPKPPKVIKPKVAPVVTPPAPFVDVMAEARKRQKAINRAAREETLKKMAQAEADAKATATKTLATPPSPLAPPPSPLAPPPSPAPPVAVASEPPPAPTSETPPAPPAPPILVAEIPPAPPAPPILVAETPPAPPAPAPAPPSETPPAPPPAPPAPPPAPPSETPPAPPAPPPAPAPPILVTSSMPPARNEADQRSQLIEIERALAKMSMLAFTEMAFPIVEPSTSFQNVWHIKVICEHLEAVARGEIKQLLIAIPGRHLKSTLCTTLFLPWIWTWDPSRRVIHASYTEKLSIRDSIKSRRVVESDWYRERFSNRDNWGLRTDQNTQEAFANTRGGHRYALSVGGRALGEGGDIILADDPQNADEIRSPTERERVARWWFETMISRVDNPQKAAFVVVQQRLHPEDVIGIALARDLGYEYLCLMSEFVPERRYITYKTDQVTGERTEFSRDPRQEKGELLFPSSFSKEVLERVKKSMGSATYSAQHQQDPSDASNASFKPEWWRFWREPSRAVAVETGRLDRPVGCKSIVDQPAMALPPLFDRLVIVVDCTLHGENAKDFTVVQVWAAVGGDRFLLEQHRGKFSLTHLYTLLGELHERYKLAQILVEDSVVGPAVVNDMSKTIPGVTSYKVQGEGTKEARAFSILPQIESGNVFLPEGANWLDEYVDEFTAFPGKNDDQVDCTSGALRRLLVGIGGSSGLPGAIVARVNVLQGSKNPSAMPPLIGRYSNAAPSREAIIRRFR